MLSGPKGTEHDLIATCGVCGHVEELFELPGRTGKCCLECSADLATVILLSAEIDAATLGGRNSNALITEFSEVSGRMLERSQSAQFLVAERQRARCPRKYSAAGSRNCRSAFRVLERDHKLRRARRSKRFEK